ncbi:MAG: HAD family hydrolase [Acutalibacteraceae bacterium]
MGRGISKLMIKAVIFDLDGTLLNTLDDLGNSVNFMLEKYGYKTFSMDEYKYKVGNGMRKLIERSMPENHQSEEEITQALDIFMAHYEKHKMDKTAPYDGIIDLLKQLKKQGIKTAVVTNKADVAAKPLIAEVFPNLFDEVTGQKEGVPTKPNPTVVFNVMKQLDVTPNECIFVGDSGVDMQTAKNSGAFALGVLWGFRKADELIENGAEKIISKPNELLELI